MKYEEGDIVLCTVEKIVGTTVFVKIENDGEGSIVISEIAAGRIRNLREYVVPKKKIVCKVLRVSEKNIDLSLRRVSQKETKERMEKFNKEKSYKSILKTILKEDFKEIEEKIEKKQTIYEFLIEAKKNPENLEKEVGKERAEKILEILNKEKAKKAEIKKKLKIKTEEPNGREIIKDSLKSLKEAEIHYLGSGKYSIKVSEENLKKADKKLQDLVDSLLKSTKGKNISIELE
jgi:translation initiation factor 2 alpha subunit (eIF-2alpha)